MSYLLDSSAWLCHLLEEAGADEVDALLDSDAEVSISSLSVLEVYARLKALSKDEKWLDVWTGYQSLFAHIRPVDLTVAQRAVEIRGGTPRRVPAIDSLIAATASAHGLTLVHRDPHHMGAIPDAFVKAILLPEK